jgi:gamma-glutamyltranspeptidase/glutathione hydrolase
MQNMRRSRRLRTRVVVLLVATTVSLTTASARAQRPLVAGRTAGVSAGHPLTSAAALETLLQGGNAFDAGVTALLVGGVVEQDLYGLGGESLILVYPQAEQKVTSINGQGWAPKGASLDWYRTRSTSRGLAARARSCCRR